MKSEAIGYLHDSEALTVELFECRLKSCQAPQRSPCVDPTGRRAEYRLRGKSYLRTHPERFPDVAGWL